jgi:hypothetical protein
MLFRKNGELVERYGNKQDTHEFASTMFASAGT